MSTLTPAVVALLADVTSAFRVTEATRVKRGAAIFAAVAGGASDANVATAATDGGQPVSRGTVGFYRRTFALYVQVDVDSPVVFGDLWSVVTRGKGITDDDVVAVIVKGDGPATRKALAALVADRKQAAADAAKDAKDEGKTAEAIAENTGAGVAPMVAGRDYAALVAGLIASATTPEARKRLAVALAAGLENLNGVERAARKAA